MRKINPSFLAALFGFITSTAFPVAASAVVFEKARWIAPPPHRAANAPCPLFRKEFVLDHKPRAATLRIVGLGDYDAWVNGRRLAPTSINQPWSQYEKTLYYRDFDLTPRLISGRNCVGVMLFNSFWHNPNPPAGRYNKAGPQRSVTEPYLLCAEIIVKNKDGSVVRVGTDTSWRVADGPFTFSHVYAGEDFDARRQLAGWDRAGFDDGTWQPARETTAPSGKLEAQFWPGFAMFERQQPVSVKQPASNVFLYSFPQNMAAQLRVELEGGKPGDTVQFRGGEHKDSQDHLFGAYIVGC